MMMMSGNGVDRSSEGSRWSSGGTIWNIGGCWRSGTGLVGPGVVGEPGAEPLVLAGAGVGVINVAPSGASTVSTATIALYCAILINKCEGGALAANVDIWRGSLGDLSLEGRTGDGGHHGQHGDCLPHHLDDLVCVILLEN